MPLALPELLWLAALIVAFGLITCGQAFTDSLIWIIKATVGQVPGLGSLFAKPAEAALQRLSNALGHYADAVGHDIARSWHFLATVIDRIGWTMFHLSMAIERLTWYMLVAYPVARLWSIANLAYSIASRASHAVAHAVTHTTIVRQYIVRPVGTPLAAAVRAVMRPFVAETHTFERWTRAQLDVAEGAATSVAQAPVRVGYTARQLRRLSRRLTTLEKLTVGAGAAAMVAAALGRLGLGWVRCGKVGRAGRQVCGMDTDLLESLLGGALLLTSAISLEQLARELQDPTELVTDALRALVKEF